MENSIENNSKNNFLKEGFVGAISKHHKGYLGTTVPEGYFEKSKASILDKIKSEEKETTVQKKRQLLFRMFSETKYAAAASLVFLFGLAVWFQNINKKETFSSANFEMLSFTEDNLINSLLVSDAEFEVFVDATLLNEIVIKAEISERQMDDLFMNSLFIEDSLMDNYTSEIFIETIIL